MAKGGARIRSGPAPDEGSERSERRGYKLSELPAEGYNGPIPEFPLPRRRVYDVDHSEKPPRKYLDEEATEQVAQREAALWEWAWRTPQACAWSLPSESWRIHTIAMWVRTFVICESTEGTAADKSSLHRFADQIGLTTAGLREMGWKVAASDQPQPTESGNAAVPSARSRLKVVPDE